MLKHRPSPTFLGKMVKKRWTRTYWV
ncbi:hypothetical protein P5673_031253 [Acropora cervicornis]|uniref:Uncharacterized protein n=1 Tax=Acropora cervicornis TaxID=6130 RepID=A0AAD9PT91_ACRCE|nr:hypothetical protein P5673_031253 [Acropora cervicornis]